jgi:pantoate--beta-alanine ligase
LRTLRTIEKARAELPRDGIGLVPTMGALHAGHVALFGAARSESEVVVASIFVNPAQFGAGEDFERYPRDEGADAAIAEAAGVDFLFVPSVEEMYPAGFETWVDVDGVSARLEGAARPGHFRGVATVCIKLFNILRPERAYFGQKDAQQAAVLERLVEDLNLDLEIRVVATVRDEDGLAVSSRNAYLSAEERASALALPQALTAGREAHARGADPVEAARSILAAEPGLEPDYVELAQLDGRVFLLAAARAGRTRLIDNVVLEGDPL